MNFDKLKNCIDNIVVGYKTPGVDCVVYKDHEMLFRYYAGMSDIENNIKMQGDEMYYIFSMSKIITCTAALQLFEQGKYKMEDPLSMYMPEFAKMKISSDKINSENGAKIATGGSQGEETEVNQSGYAKNPIRIIDLFTMSAGLSYNLGDKAISQARKEGKTSTRDLVGAMANMVLLFEPGTRFQYSLCHDVLGALIEIWSGEKLGKYMENHIFAPLGMKNTFFGRPSEEGRIPNMAARYIFDKNGVPQRANRESVYVLAEGYECGGAGLVSCPEDYAVFLDALACGGTAKNGVKLLEKETVERMRTNHLDEQQLEDFHYMKPGYGYGLGVRTHMDKEKSGSLSPMGEFGWDGAAGAFAMADADRKLSLTYFQHIHNWDPQIQTDMKNALYQCLGE